MAGRVVREAVGAAHGAEVFWPAAAGRVAGGRQRQVALQAALGQGAAGERHGWWAEASSGRGATQTRGGPSLVPPPPPRVHVAQGSVRRLPPGVLGERPSKANPPQLRPRGEACVRAGGFVTGDGFARLRGGAGEDRAPRPTPQLRPGLWAWPGCLSATTDTHMVASPCSMPPGGGPSTSVPAWGWRPHPGHPPPALRCFLSRFSHAAAAVSALRPRCHLPEIPGGGALPGVPGPSRIPPDQHPTGRSPRVPGQGRTGPMLSHFPRQLVTRAELRPVSQVERQAQSQLEPGAVTVTVTVTVGGER